MDNSNIGTTGIDALPTAGSGGEENVQLTTKELSTNTVVENPVKELQEKRELDQNELIKGIQQAAASGATALPSRDIPIDKTQISTTQFDPGVTRGIPKVNPRYTSGLPLV